MPAAAASIMAYGGLLRQRYICPGGGEECGRSAVPGLLEFASPLRLSPASRERLDDVRRDHRAEQRLISDAKQHRAAESRELVS